MTVDHGGVTANGLKDIIEIMRYAAGKLAQGSHSFGVRRLHLSPFSGRYLLANPRLGEQEVDEQEGDPVEGQNHHDSVDDH
jgi:hypothetical protein